MTVNAIFKMYIIGLLIYIIWSVIIIGNKYHRGT